MSASSDSRRQRRAMKASGVEFLERVAIDEGALAAAVMNGVNLVELVSYHVATALEALDLAGADVVSGHTVVSIGEHPDFPGAVTIEAKAATRKRVE